MTLAIKQGDLNTHLLISALASQLPVQANTSASPAHPPDQKFRSWCGSR